MNPAGFLFLGAGLFSAMGGICDWEWFMNHRKARFLSMLVGRFGARVIYVLIGSGLSVLGAMVLMGKVTLHS